MRVGFVGAGLMGGPMVRRLLGASFEVTVSSRHPSRLAGRGWKVVGSPAEAARGAEVVCSIVPDSPEVTDVVSSVLQTAAPGTVLVEMSTIAPTTARRLAVDCAERGVSYLDCPVSGGPAGAEAGTLAIWVGGDPTALERARPVLSVLGDPDRLRHCGDVGAGLVVKLANNLLGASIAAVCAEALAMAGRAGVDLDLVVEAVSGGTGANWQLANLFSKKVLRGDFTAGFKIGHMTKDLAIAAQLAADLGIDQPVFSRARARFEDARALVGDLADYGSVARLSGFGEAVASDSGQLDSGDRR